jgi:signal transduction histidine kinase
MIFDLDRNRTLGVLLDVCSAGVLGYVLVLQYLRADIGTWDLALGGVSLLAWLVFAAIGRRPSSAVATVIGYSVMVLAAAAAAGATNGLMIVAAAIGVLRLVSDVTLPLWLGIAGALAAAAFVAIGTLPVEMSPLGLLSMEAGIALGAVGGVSRRQAIAARTRERELLESEATAREQQARAQGLEHRQAMARDIHDVLAHSLGGVVVQLDAVDALLEAGRVGDAAGRVHDARLLAATGLADARRAVDALRSPRAAEPVDGAELIRHVSTLVDAHRRMSGDAALRVEGAPAPMPADLADALRRAVQEALSNVRKHAAGAPVEVELRFSGDRVELNVSNPLLAPHAVLAGTGGGHGLTGMRERFDAVPDGRAEYGVRDDGFVVHAEARL